MNPLRLVRQLKDTVEERKRKHQHEADGDLGTSSSPELFQSKGIIILIKQQPLPWSLIRLIGSLGATLIKSIFHLDMSW